METAANGQRTITIDAALLKRAREAQDRIDHLEHHLKVLEYNLNMLAWLYLGTPEGKARVQDVLAKMMESGGT